jgi:hypothetical protein
MSLALGPAVAEYVHEYSTARRYFGTVLGLRGRPLAEAIAQTVERLDLGGRPLFMREGRFLAQASPEEILTQTGAPAPNPRLFSACQPSCSRRRCGPARSSRRGVRVAGVQPRRPVRRHQRAWDHGLAGPVIQRNDMS